MPCHERTQVRRGMHKMEVLAAALFKDMSSQAQSGRRTANQARVRAEVADAAPDLRPQMVEGPVRCQAVQLARRRTWCCP